MKKQYKFLVLVSLILIFTLTLTGCQKPYYYDYEKMKEKIEKIEIINLHYLNTEKIIDSKKLLNDVETDDFLSNLSKIKFSFVLGDPPKPSNYNVIFYYFDQNYEILDYKSTEIYNKEKQLIKFIGRRCYKEEFYDLISKFVDITT